MKLNSALNLQNYDPTILNMSWQQGYHDMYKIVDLTGY